MEQVKNCGAIECHLEPIYFNITKKTNNKSLNL